MTTRFIDISSFINDRKHRSLSSVVISIFLHTLVIGTVITLVHFVSPPRPTISIDLSLLENVMPDTVVQAPQEKARTEAAKTIVKEIVKPKPVTRKPIPRAKPIVSDQQIFMRDEAPEPEMFEEAPPPELEFDEELPVEEVVNMLQPPIQQPVMPLASAVANAIPKAPPMDVRQKNPQQQYLSAHFLYIKEEIQQSIDYPKVARRMGWEGKVVLSFVVCENGNVIDIRVVKSSGYAVLDKNAITTVKQRAPFPRPPVRAELTLPISYRLG